MSAQRRLSIIIPSYNDPRIAIAIASVREFDDLGTVRLIVIDGGSTKQTLDIIAPLVGPDDHFVSEQDKGIFDALNKGLDRSNTEYIGWLGSDDLFTGRVKASDVVAALETHDLYIANVALFQNATVLRVTHALPARLGLVKFGLNNPHFGTFGRSAILKSERFRLDLLGSDIEYFLRIFAKKPTVVTSGAIAVLMSEGGFSTGSSKKYFRLHSELNREYAKHTNAIVAVLALSLKAGYKAVDAAYRRLVRRGVASILTEKLAHILRGHIET